MTFGQKLEFIRKDILRLTQAEMGESINFTQAAINAVESGKNKKGSFELFRQLVLVHHVNPFYFIYEKTDEPAILKREGAGTKSLVQKIAKYEKLIGQMNSVMSGK